LSHLKLQKLLYYIQAWHLVFFDKDPMFDEPAEAWVSGPVYRSVYDFLNDKGIRMYDDLTIDLPKTVYENAQTTLFNNISEEQRDFLDVLLKKYAFKPDSELVLLTHSEKPWNNARAEADIFEYSNEIIDYNSMYNYYRSRLKPQLQNV
jgi:uncharacterized phage-associated protein